MTAPRPPRRVYLLGASLALVVGCAHQREAHYPPSGGTSEPVLTSPSASARSRSSSKSSQAQRSSSKRSDNSQARLDSNDDSDRFDFDQVRD